MEADFNLLRDRYRGYGLNPASADAMALTAARALAAAKAREPSLNGKVETYAGGGA